MASTLSALRVHHIEEAIALYDLNGDGTSPTLEEVLAYMKTERDDAYPYRCAKCGGNGQYPGSLETKDPADTAMVTCDQCGGVGQRTTPNRAIISGYEDVPVEI